MNHQENNIGTEQNSPRKMDQLAAKSKLYSLAERIQLTQAFLPVVWEVDQ